MTIEERVAAMGRKVWSDTYHVARPLMTEQEAMAVADCARIALEQALDTDGLVVTTKSRAEVGEAVERLPILGGIDRHHGFWRATVPTWDERLAVIKTADDPAAAIDAALGECGCGPYAPCPEHDR